MTYTDPYAATSTQRTPTDTSGGYDPAAYDPTSAQPYTPPSAPVQLPPITAPPPGPAAAGDMQQTKGPNLLPGGKGSKAASIAYMADSMLKGFMRGREQRQQQTAYKANRLMQGLQYNYQNAAAHYTDMMKRGVDPKSKEAQEAEAAADAAWQSMMKMYGNYISPDSGKSKKGKGGGGSGGGSDEQANPAQVLLDPKAKPEDKAKAWYQMSIRAGPPYKYQAQQYQTPEYQKGRELYRGEQQMRGDIQQKRLDLHKLQNWDEKTQGAMSAEDKAKLERLQTDPELFPSMGGAPKKETEYIGEDHRKHVRYRRPDGSTFEEIAEEKVQQPVSLSKGRVAWGKDAHGKLYSFLVDPVTNQPMLGTEDYKTVPSQQIKNEFQADTIRTGEFSWKDENGVLHRSQTTSTTTHVPHGQGASATPPASTTPPGTTPPPKGDRTIGSTGPQGQTKSRADAADSMMPLLTRARQMLEDPEVANNLGPLSGRWSEVQKKIGNLPRKTREFAGVLTSIYSLGGTMHGWRSLKVADEFRKQYGDINADPESLKGGLDAMEGTAKAIYETGYKHPWQSHPATSAPKPPKEIHPEVKKFLDSLPPAPSSAPSTPPQP